MAASETNVPPLPSNLSVIDEIRYRRSMVRLGILIGSCFVLLVVLIASFIITKISQDKLNSIQQAERSQGVVVEQKLCTTLNSLRDLKPPPGDPVSNPSRAYLQQQHDKLAQLSVDVGCKKG
jgi:hypothetical protein